MILEKPVWEKTVLAKPILEKIGLGKNDFGKTRFVVEKNRSPKTISQKRFPKNRSFSPTVHFGQSLVLTNR